MSTWLRVLGLALNMLGAIVLAIRVKRLMDTTAAVCRSGGCWG